MNSQVNNAMMYAQVTNTSAMLRVYESPMLSVQRKATTLYPLTMADGRLRHEKRRAVAEAPPVSASVDAAGAVARRARRFTATQDANWKRAITAMKHAMAHQSSWG